MNRWGCIAGIAGVVIGVLVVVVFAQTAFVTPLPAIVEPPSAASPDVMVFVSEQSLSRMASESLPAPTVVDFEADGQMEVVTRTTVQGLEPVVHAGLLLQMQGFELVSQLRWIRFGSLIVPARWLPPEAVSAAGAISDEIEAQIPPGFTLVGFTTAAEGVTLQLEWVGP